MKIFRGTKGADRRRCHWIEPRTTWQFELQDLVYGLGSHYWRDRCEGDEPPPEELSASGVIAIVKQEYERYGTNAVWTWTDHLEEGEYEKAEAWARAVILRVLHELEVEGPA